MRGKKPPYEFLRLKSLSKGVNFMSAWASHSVRSPFHEANELDNC